MKPCIMVIDDEKNYLVLLKTLLEDEGYEIVTFSDPEIALSFLEDSDVDVIITDVRMPNISGQELLERVKKKYPHIPVIIMTAYGTVDGAVEAMKCGAFDYITKPFSNDELLLTVQKAVRLSFAEKQNLALKKVLQEKHSPYNIVGKSKVIQDILELVQQVSQSDSNVLITGESGTGKELIAKTIHFSSKRKDGPFVAVNCAALNPNLLESELFGHEKGSFTGATHSKRGRFELAHKGTLFLDEIGELPLELQAKLLRFIQERSFERVGGTTSIKVDVRIIAATNKDLKQAVEKKEFREDLYYRLNVVNIHMPPLRERVEDIPLLAAHFLKIYSEKNQKNIKGFTSKAMDLLISYRWPGNVRELENVIERAVVLCKKELIDIEDLPPELKEEEHFKSVIDLLPHEINLNETLEKIEAALIKRALVKSNFIQSKAAKMLGISKSLLQYKLKKYKITPTHQ